MGDVAIRVENLGKLYHIGARQPRRERLYDVLADAVSAPIRRAKKLLSGQATGAAELDETIWALKDVSFEVKRGEVVGIIGRNGAGKSTLLKILSRITEPTEGYAEVFGRVGSLLEVGTGFHPELTGRENVYLNGTILGMRREEIDRKFDEIVAFAEVEKFIDTPVKHYSSGMYVRLAFSVAAHLEPEILLVDEVLAVGDAAFQKKCLGKMSDVAEEGRTVLFVSHNMDAIQRLTGRALLLDCGDLVTDGKTRQVISTYLSADRSQRLESSWKIEEAPGDDVAKLHGVRVKVNGKVADSQIDIREPIEIEVMYWNLQQSKAHVILILRNELGVELFTTSDNLRNPSGHPPGLIKSICTIPGNFLAEGRIDVLVSVGSFNPNKSHLSEERVVSFSVFDPAIGDSVRGEYVNRWPGVIRPMLEWSSEHMEPHHLTGL